MNWYVRPSLDDRRYWTVSRTHNIGGLVYFGCTNYYAVIDDFGNLVRVRDLFEIVKS